MEGGSLAKKMLVCFSFSLFAGYSSNRRDVHLYRGCGGHHDYIVGRLDSSGLIALLFPSVVIAGRLTRLPACAHPIRRA